jgi:hypothetical protein
VSAAYRRIIKYTTLMGVSKHQTTEADFGQNEPSQGTNFLNYGK